ncbi:endonuclease/exonuclease/phosphatase family protein [Anaeromyxobacter oryzisoli]|uniref:endonuclease/exonuclease/phosphatase family protein n=1 Tax=Anaeromyxobacter oryzisoli TaxID=2925408 RepID=UPI001F56A2E0|nr:endonuclease/exonuclease/phosphatase family protein [Anaeromyxobacter sp. SG63]
MARPTASFALALLAAACGPLTLDPATGEAGSRIVRIATWNVHDLFDAEDRRAPPGEQDLVPSAPEVAAKLERVATVLRRVDADLVLLQEVENAAILEALARLAGYPEARLVEGNDPRGIDVAFLSRRPVVAYVSHREDRDAAGRLLWPRDCVEAHVDVGGAGRVVVVGSHFSSPLSDDGTRRALQATRLRELADAAATGGAVLVLAGGDLNDSSDGSALAPLLGDGAWGEPAAGPLEQSWTWSGSGRLAVLDHLALQRASAGAILAAEVIGGAEIAAASDHRPVLLQLELGLE